MTINPNELEPILRSLEEKALINDPTCPINQNFLRFENFEFPLSEGSQKNKEVSQWKDLKVKVEVILGSAKLSGDKIASLKEGSIVVFEELADEFVDIYINGKKVAKGRIATADNHYAIQIVHILDKKERILLNT